MMPLDVANYVAGNNTQYFEDRRFLERMKKYMKFKENESILDVGCGPGNVTVELLLPMLPSDVTLVGGDLPHMVDYANIHHAKPNVSYKYINIEDPQLKMTWKESSYDKVFSMFCEHWITDHRQSFSNIGYLLKTGGQLYMLLVAISPHSLSEREVITSKKWLPHAQGLGNLHCMSTFPDDSEQMYVQIMKDNNFQNHSCISENIVTVHKHVDTLKAFFKGVSDIAAKLPADLVESYIDDYLKAAFRNKIITANEDKSEFYVKCTTISIFASKI